MNLSTNRFSTKRGTFPFDIWNQNGQLLNPLVPKPTKRGASEDLSERKIELGPGEAKRYEFTIEHFDEASGVKQPIPVGKFSIEATLLVMTAKKEGGYDIAVLHSNSVKIEVGSERK